MNPKDRDAAIELILSLERQIATLEKLLTHQPEIDACKNAIERLKSRLDETSIS